MITGILQLRGESLFLERPLWKNCPSDISFVNCHKKRLKTFTFCPNKMRVCMVSATYSEVKKGKNGFYVDGTGGRVYTELIRMMDKLYPQNNTYYITTKTDKCNERLKNNLSDFSTATMPPTENMTGYKMPVPLMASKVSFVSGYDTVSRALKPKDCADAFSNFALLDASVYFYSLLLILPLVLMVAFNTWMRWKRKKKKRASLVKFTLKNILTAYYWSSDDFRVVSLLFVILSFYLVNSFKSVYKTSKIIVEEPFVVKNYHELLEDETALPLFYNPLTKVSDQFEFAPKNSLRGQIWSKLSQRTGGNAADFLVQGLDKSESPIDQMRELFKRLDQRNYVMFGMSGTAKLVKEFFCAISPEKELWQVFLFSDPSENENLLGYFLSTLYPNEKYFIHGQRKYAQSDLINAFYKKARENAKLFAYFLLSTTRAHKYSQDLLCRGYAVDPGIHVEALGLNYFASFFRFALLVFIIARIVLAYEHLMVKDPPGPQRIDLTCHYVSCNRGTFQRIRATAVWKNRMS